MEERNRRDLLNIIGNDVDHKIHLLMEYTTNLKDIDDPWYSGDFDTAFDEINNEVNDFDFREKINVCCNLSLFKFYGFSILYV